MALFPLQAVPQGKSVKPEPVKPVYDSVTCPRCGYSMSYAHTFTVIWKGSTLWDCARCGCETTCAPGTVVVPPQDPDNFSHGSYNRYLAGCRCEKCRYRARRAGKEVDNNGL